MVEEKVRCAVSIILENPFYLLIILAVPVLWFSGNKPFLGEGLGRYRWPILGMRSLLILVLALALSNPVFLKYSDRVNLFFCNDVSESIGHDQQEAVKEFIRAGVRGMGKEDQAGLILFGKEPSMEMGLTMDYKDREEYSEINRSFTNISEALKLAIGKMPENGKNRIVLFTDGNENIGHAVDMAYPARSLGIEIFPVPIINNMNQAEVSLETLETPSNVNLNTLFEIRIVVLSSDENMGELILQRNENVVTRKTVVLHPGKNLFSFYDTLETHGLYRYKSIITLPDDHHFQNNEGLSFSRAMRDPALLYLTELKEGESPAISALIAQGMDIDRRGPEEMPQSLYDLADYNAIVIDNVAGNDIPFQLLENIERYVRDMGGGLIMIGGEKSFGAGHYLKTPVEKALPVHMDVTTNMEFAGVCMILIIDKSHSMAGTVSGKSKLEMAKIAAFSTVELLNPIDSVGIIAFDTEFEWVVRPTRVRERQKIANQLSILRGEGGTDVYPALKDAFNALSEYPAAKKHILILSDGNTKEAEFIPLIEAIRAEHITISTVAVGQDSDIPLMAQIAELGGGRGYYTDNPDNIPRIFTDETQIVARNLIIEGPMQTLIKMKNDILKGIPDSFPMVYGQVLTSLKAGADLILETKEGPLLVTGQYGLGRTVAVTSDLSKKWGKDWIVWEHYGKFMSQIVKWAQKKEVPRKYIPTIEKRGGEGEFSVDVLDNFGGFVNNLNLEALVLFPDGTSRQFLMDQNAPGKYHTFFPSENAGEYYLNLIERNEDGSSPSQSYGFGISYTEEFAIRDTNNSLLKELASITNGRVLDINKEYGEIFDAKSDRMEYGGQLWPYLTVAFLVLLICDVVLRKILEPRF